MEQSCILVIKHGALGDMVLATAAFAAIRNAHASDHIVLLTTAPFAGLMTAAPYFNDVWIDEKPGLLDHGGIRRLRAQLHAHRWQWIFDLQTSRRTTLYQWLLRRPWPNISSASRWSSHSRPPYDRKKHALENLGAQLAVAGLKVSAPDISWMVEDIAAFRLKQPYTLMVPGGAPHRPEKRWPERHYAALAAGLAADGVTPVLIGSGAEQGTLADIAAEVPKAVNLCGRTSIAQIASLARAAAGAVGNDTGPMHVIAAAGCPSTVIFGPASDPARSAPVGAVTVLRDRDLSVLGVPRVRESLQLPLRGRLG